ncbi:MAG: PAS domain-containing sensor histidine kinase [Alphaproteobacteria bacterium]
MAAPLSMIWSGIRRRLLKPVLWMAHPARIATAAVVAAIASGVLTFLAISQKAPFERASPDLVLGLLLLNLVAVVALGALVIWLVVRILVARRSHSAGARLHTQLVLLFGLVAVVPTIVVAVFSAITLNLGVEAWFSARVKTALQSSVELSREYVNAQAGSIDYDIRNLQQILSRIPPEVRNDRLRMAEILRSPAVRLINLHSIHILDSDGRAWLRVSFPDASGRSIDGMADPAPEVVAKVPYDNTLWSLDEGAGLVRALMRLPWAEGRILYIGRAVSPQALAYKRETLASFESYQRMEANRFNVQVAFIGVYVVVSLLVMLAAAWLGLTFANRIVQPIGRLIGAAERVSNGDLSARVDVGRTRDEIEGLGRAFNRMTGQLQSQRNELVEANRQADERRRFTETVLSGVSAGVVGTNAQGVITVVNRSALRLLGLEKEQVIGRALSEIMPDLMSLLVSARSGGRTRAQIDLKREDGERRLNVRISSEPSLTGDDGQIVTFDDITELVAAQRTAAWADVARRIAHEIKNPLTPIQLSAERLRRKYKKEVSTDPEIFDQCTDTIIRHVSDIGRMVDEFSSFARMPEPVFQVGDLTDLVRQAVFLQKVGLPDVNFKTDLPQAPVFAACDGRLISQVLVNVIKNAGEAIATRLQNEGETGAPGEIRVRLVADGANALIEIADNGGGWPKALKARLTEPYVTTRKKGTGLGLAIVQKVLEDHSGRLVLADHLRSGAIQEGDSAPDADIIGAAVRMTLPLQRAKPAASPAKQRISAPA